ncbi:MAG: LysM peptidoglycan-binding domain-containing protein [Flavobacteriaceae bacterium]|jgi:membrane-bound lytic murein transglycosylase D|nr:LysM peptidoglycan-binding domain-containing protein [Flavobacteriaceae bacterium]
MRFKNITITLAILFIGIVSAQETEIKEIRSEQTKMTFLDSIKSTFVHHDMASCIDDRWVNELMNQDLFQEMNSDVETLDMDVKIDYELSSELLKERLKILDSKSAFNIDYNPGLENVIKHYLKNRSRSFERLMSLSQYYFPIFEEALSKYNVPLEIKYLAIVESALNPRAVSKAGATGIWQFMYATGKQYNLDVTTFVDERSDILKASEAACQYMVKMYSIFGDWDLVLASYNAGPGNVSKAIRRSGGKQNYWNIRPYLPKETQGYVPAFLATMYVYEFHKEHGIVPQKAVMNTFETDTIQVKSKMSFKQLSEVLDISITELQFLNPSYKRDFIPYMADKKHYVRLPVNKAALFVSNEEKVYAYIEHDFNKREKPFSTMEALANADANFSTNTKYHIVKKGETLGGISSRYRVSIANLKKWNGLRSDVIGVGQKLKVVTTERVAVVSKKETPKTNVTPQKDTIITNPVSTEPSFYVVEKDDDIAEIAQKHKISVEDLKKWNQLESDEIQVGQKLVLKQTTQESESTDFKLYTILKGDNLFTIAKKNNVSIENLKEWNELEDIQIKEGSVLKILKTEKISEIASTENKPHKVVEKKEIEIPQETYYIVKKGDSLFSISQNIPGVTVSDLKKWNGINNKTVIKPGMKLKINGETL